MTGLLEDFGCGVPTAKVAPAPAPQGVDRYDDGYNAGWEDAMAQAESEQHRIGAHLAARLADLQAEHDQIQHDVIANLEPVLRDVFDKVLPRAAERGFHGVLMEEIAVAFDAAASPLSIAVAPENVAAISHLLTQTDIPQGKAIVTGEAALSVSQALIRWTGQERRIDLDGVLADLDEALDTHFSILDRGQNAADVKEA